MAHLTNATHQEGTMGPSPDDLLRVFRAMGGTVGPLERAAAERFVRRFKRKMMHVYAACLVSDLAKDDAFGARSPHMAVFLADEHYQARGCEFAATRAEAFDELAQYAKIHDVSAGELERLTQPFEPDA